MTIQLESIAFNHDPAAAEFDALNIRKNNLEFIQVPEWQRGVSTRPGDSLAAYAINETRGKTITIEASFSAGISLRNSIVEIRALPFSPTAMAPMPFFMPFLSSYYVAAYYHAQQQLWSDMITRQSHVLGPVKAKQIAIAQAGKIGPVTFELARPRIWDHGVGKHTIAWRWQIRLWAGGPWWDFAVSQHQIYTVLDVPTRPWRQSPYHPANNQLPWAEVLEYACQWAGTATTTDDAARRVTQTVYDLGSNLLSYACDTGGAARYTDLFFDYFYCTEFLERLGGGVGRGSRVNCSDCATIVSSFSNILGCDLWQSRMGTGNLVFVLNPIKAIGYDRWQPACQWPGFSMHEVAWKGACREDDEVYDACLELDGDPDPTRAPHTPLVPINMPFGNINDGQYRDRLAAPRNNAREICQPTPGTRQRRRVI